MTLDPASFRDPAGQVHIVEGRVFRSVQQIGMDDYLYVRDSGALEPLINDGQVLGGEEISPSVLDGFAPDGGAVLEHPKIAFWTYPYEWSFGALRAAALLHLDLQIELLEHDITLSDASAYNVQFVGPRPVFIDMLSFRRYRQDEHWLGHRQFCEQFLNPLLLKARFDIDFNDFYRGRLDGISTSDIASLSRWRDYLSWRMLSHVVLPSRLQASGGDRSLESAVKAQGRGIPKSSYVAILAQLRRWIAGLSMHRRHKTVWEEYARDNTYADQETGAKRGVVAEFAKSVRPRLLLDLGCNTGNYSKLVLESGGTAVIGLDADHGALEQAFERAVAEGLNFQPLYQDFANPSPGQGWNLGERKSLADRCSEVDAVIALAFEHHLAIGRNIPLPNVVQWITSLAPQGIIEFVRKEDTTVQKMLALRGDIFPDYSIETFIEALSKHARIMRRERVSAEGRELFWFDRSD